MIVHSLDALPPLQQSAYVVADGGSFAVAPARPVLTASLAPVALPQSRPPAQPDRAIGAAPASLPMPMFFMSLAALALMLCARGYSAAGRRADLIPKSLS